MTDQLKTIFENVNNWLKFAEAKNVILVGFCAGLFYTLLKEISPSCFEQYPIRSAYLVSLMIFTAIGAITALVSFLPLTRMKWIAEKEAPDEHDNALFFGDIQKYESAEYVVFLRKVLKYSGEATDLDHHFAEQITTNATLASKKFFLFRLAMWALIFGIVTPVVGVVLYGLIDPNR